MTGTRFDDVEYINSIPAEDFQECSKHERAERGNALKSTKGFEFCDFPLIKSLVNIISFLIFTTPRLYTKKVPLNSEKYLATGRTSKDRGST